MIERQEKPFTFTVLFGASIILLVAYYTFLIAMFYIHGLHHYSYADIAAQTPNVGNGVLSTSPPKALLLLVGALLVAGLGPYVLPLAVLGLSGTLLWRWTSLRWSGRLFWISVILTAFPVLNVMWSQLGRSIFAWLLD